jgi:microcystin-dependent protein
MAEPYLGQISLVGFNFAPRNWTLCNGQLLPINQYQSLYSLYGTMYGGDGRTTFALPKMQGRVPIHRGQGAGLTNRVQGHVGGYPTNTLVANNLPAHTHTVTANMRVSEEDANTADSEGNALAAAAAYNAYVNAAADTNMIANSVSGTSSNTGGGTAINNMQPYQAITFIIALTGLFPSRN